MVGPQGGQRGHPGGAGGLQEEVMMTDDRDALTLTLDDGALPGGHTVGGGVLLSSRLGQHGDGASCKQSSYY